ncbi:MAG: type I 3-dehydroquinate dehydratase [Promethearchaeota archaeon]|nr:MAG: type I 3-dehydroquinate dehydratase [Candidatus Lokiarchaeota archaeon]
MNNRICISIPINSGSIKINRKIIERALEYHPNFLELRFDYIKDISLINPEFLNHLIEIISPKSSSIFTFRAYKEGGNRKIQDESKQGLLSKLTGAKPDYLDIEMSTEDHILSKIIDSCVKEKVKIVFSSHDFNATPPLGEIKNSLHLFIDRLKNKINVDLELIEKCVFKIVLTAKKFEDNLVPLNLCADLKGRYKIISFCMGSKGVFSRFFCPKFGSFFTYASFEKETAPGQIKIEKIKNFYQKMYFF